MCQPSRWSTMPVTCLNAELVERKPWAFRAVAIADDSRRNRRAGPSISCAGATICASPATRGCTRRAERLPRRRNHHLTGRQQWGAIRPVHVRARAGADRSAEVVVERVAAPQRRHQVRSRTLRDREGSTPCAAVRRGGRRRRVVHRSVLHGGHGSRCRRLAIAGVLPGCGGQAAGGAPSADFLVAIPEKPGSGPTLGTLFLAGARGVVAGLLAFGANCDRSPQMLAI